MKIIHKAFADVYAIIILFSKVFMVNKFYFLFLFRTCLYIASIINSSDMKLLQHWLMNTVTQYNYVCVLLTRYYHGIQVYK